MLQGLEDDERAERVPDEGERAAAEDALREEVPEDAAGALGELLGCYPGIVCGMDVR